MNAVRKKSVPRRNGKISWIAAAALNDNILGIKGMVEKVTVTAPDIITRVAAANVAYLTVLIKLLLAHNISVNFCRWHSKTARTIKR